MMNLNSHTLSDIWPLGIIRTNVSHQVNTQAVATHLGYANHRSVANRVSALKKKYDIPFGPTYSKATKDDGPAVPATPSKNRVAKKVATPRKKKTPAKAEKEASDHEMEAEKEQQPENEDEDVEDVSDA